MLVQSPWLYQSIWSFWNLQNKVHTLNFIININNDIFFKSFICEEPISYLTQFFLFLDSLDHLIFWSLDFFSSLSLCYKYSLQLNHSVMLS